LGRFQISNSKAVEKWSLFFEQVGMSSGAFEDQKFIDVTVDNHPVWFDMKLAITGPIALQRVIEVRSSMQVKIRRSKEA
jgi:hypothetical protein